MTNRTKKSGFNAFFICTEINDDPWSSKWGHFSFCQCFLLLSFVRVKTIQLLAWQVIGALCLFYLDGKGSKYGRKCNWLAINETGLQGQTNTSDLRWVPVIEIEGRECRRRYYIQSCQQRMLWRLLDAWDCEWCPSRR